ncbi:MAG: hypothetical protein MUP16_04920 [Sedimentisphaerales bacterium]|nr:hypothetical protein [Sedimentisphaerales bacterium]
MGSLKQTAVNLNETAQKIKDELAPIYGLKNILSAGLVLFGRLSAEQQRKTITGFNTEEIEKPALKKSLRDAIQAIKKTAKKDGAGNVIKVLSEEERILLQSIRAALGPDEPKKKTKEA